MTDEVKTIRFLRNAYDARTSVPYVGGQEATVLAGVAERHVAARNAEYVEAPRETPEETPAEQPAAPSVEELKKAPKNRLIAAVTEKENS